VREREKGTNKERGKDGCRRDMRREEAKERRERGKKKRASE
jgi:hypothetical protein